MSCHAFVFLVDLAIKVSCKRGHNAAVLGPRSALGQFFGLFDDCHWTKQNSNGESFDT